MTPALDRKKAGSRILLEQAIWKGKAKQEHRRVLGGRRVAQQQHGVERRSCGRHDYDDLSRALPERIYIRSESRRDEPSCLALRLAANGMGAGFADGRVIDAGTWLPLEHLLSSSRRCGRRANIQAAGQCVVVGPGKRRGGDWPWWAFAPSAGAGAGELVA